MIHVERWFAWRTRSAELYTNGWRSLTLIWTESVDSEVGGYPLPWGVVVSKEEKRRTMALSITHRVGRVEYWKVRGVPGGIYNDPTNENEAVADRSVYRSRYRCTLVPPVDVSGCRFDMICLLNRREEEGEKQSKEEAGRLYVRWMVKNAVIRPEDQGGGGLVNLGRIGYWVMGIG